MAETSYQEQSSPPEPPRSERGERLHPLTPLARGWRIIAVLLAVLGQQALVQRNVTYLGLMLAAAIPFAAGYAFLSWVYTRYRIEADELRIDSGVLFRQTRHVRLDRLQAVDVVRPLVARLLGLAELRLEVAGGRSTEGQLAYLSEAKAQRLRAELLARAAGIAPDTPEAPERVLAKVPLGALLVSMLLSLGTIAAVGFAVLLVVVAVVLREAGLLFALVPELAGLVGAWFRHFSTYFDFTVAESPDGLRLRHGLLSHRSQTVPPGRIQAVRLVQPFLWRRLGWVKLEVNVAGYGVGERDQYEEHTLLPVAPVALAHAVLARVLPDVDLRAIPLRGVPRRARWRRPVGWRVLACGANDQVFVARRGWLRHEFDIIPHVKIQSVRLSQGPWERRLRLATLHLDSTPGPVHVTAGHRDEIEARQLVEEQAARARTARRAAGPDRWMKPRT
ncbi:hypothetical protein C3Y87_08620 [Carbonactinospora thermoautotrophica]|uniref:YdbS-like PH domain-containing protein n=3 Tax=Carbonactinospora thermoautotrophica TaxID=1469144 RepID=A0A132MI86_9ACTN|nr:PH domain-containing protein [Carbonactinospora thermoautotrophica]KWW97556.1 hypothetical protein TH66_18385 [Carbonactinospora thermoautotrophica]MCX9191474.1 hypothetical protein [Carbonactinospora thermoautotrophica]